MCIKKMIQKKRESRDTKTEKKIYKQNKQMELMV